MSEINFVPGAISNSLNRMRDFEPPPLNLVGELSRPSFDPSDIPKFREGWQQLIVIGNGFDLECGLASRYSDFVNPRRAKLCPPPARLKEQDKTWRDHILENRLTAWDVILEECADYLWNDVEKAIATWVVPGTPKNPSHFDRLLSLLNANAKSGNDTSCRQAPGYTGKRESEHGEGSVVQFILHTHPSSVGVWTEDILSEYLREQLGLFEREFMKYMKTQIDQHEEYGAKSWQLISSILRPEYPTDGREILTTILNFNYTNPITAKPWGLPLRAINIHGSLNDEIVFGIDGKDYLGNPLVAPFTKTYRLLGLHSGNQFTLFENVGSFLSVNASMDLIKFYGHSLADSDYSYFQAIFDEVNLYSGSTRLIFYYKNHNGTKDARADLTKAVARLLNEYGQTMDNSDHGKNLMHKLILEGRLSILELS